MNKQIKASSKKSKKGSRSVTNKNNGNIKRTQGNKNSNKNRNPWDKAMTPSEKHAHEKRRKERYNAITWPGWRESDGLSHPITCYNINDLKDVQCK